RLSERMEAVTKVVFGEADPRLFALPESASEQTNASSVTFIRPVALRARYAITLNGNPVTGTICARCAGVR
ncbi:MAG: hypothetical protein MUE61_08540, partial [Vicinamibacterales bacterium]|nr:hypothetical protein [Vicinamibacterales bacterium]